MGVIKHQNIYSANRSIKTGIGNLETIRNIGILAHVDAGKTTLTEQMLFYCGCVRKAGRVDDGTAHTDSLSLEQRRGISIKAQAVSMDYRDTRINVIDTPGHVDFSTEVESALLAMDGAVLVLSAVEGVQAQTVALFRILESIGLPIIIFINKTDRTGASIERVMEALGELTSKAFIATSLFSQALIDELSKYDDALLEAALTKQAVEDINSELIKKALTQACVSRNVYPVFTGAALRGLGVSELLEGIVNYLPCPATHGEAHDDKLFAVIHKVSHAKNEGRQVHVRVYDGHIDTKVPLEIQGKRDEAPEFANRIISLTPEGYRVVPRLDAGQIGILLGVKKARVGDFLGMREGSPIGLQAGFARPPLRVSVTPENPNDIIALTEALSVLGDEDPSLDVNYDSRTRETQLSIMGEIHQEILEATLLEEYNIKARFSAPTVIYRETPAHVGVASISMFYSPWYADVTLEIRPKPAGYGAYFVSELSLDYIYTRYQREIECAVMDCLGQGIYGWEITDCEIALTDGKCISISEPSSCFAPLMPIVVLEALQNAESVLLEPVYAFEIITDADRAGTVLYDLTLMRAEFDPPKMASNTVTINGVVPVATSLHYQKRLTALSHGRGLFKTASKGYYPVSPELGLTAPRKGVDPLDKSLYMMSLNGII